MAWKLVSNIDSGSPDIYGGDDIDKINKLFSGYAAVDVVDIDSDWVFRDGRLRVRNLANDFSYIVKSAAITDDREVSFPLLTENDTISFRNYPEELKNKIIDLSENTIIGVQQASSNRKWGTIQCGGVVGGNSGTGLLFGFTDQPTLPEKRVDPAPAGVYWRYATDDDRDTNAGIKYKGAAFTRRDFNARFKAKYRVVTTSSTRLYVGLNTDTTIEANDTPLHSTESGVIVGWRSGDSNFMVFRNSGTPTSSQTVTVVNTNIARGTSIMSVEIEFTNGGADCSVVLKNISTDTVVYDEDFTTNLPQSGYSMAPSIQISNTADVNREFDIFYCEIEQDC